jgi:hypothetical protein
LLEILPILQTHRGVAGKPYLQKSVISSFLDCFKPPAVLSKKRAQKERGGSMRNIRPWASFLVMTGVFTLLVSFEGLQAATSPFALLFPLAQDSCQVSCTLNVDCGQGGTCQNGRCVRLANDCVNDRWSVNTRGEVWNCNAYRCDATTGSCLRAANSNDACTFGYVFDGKSSCVPSVSCNADDPTCKDLYLRWVAARKDYENQTPAPRPTPFSCIACDKDQDCANGQMCWQNRCEKKDAYCSRDEFGEEFVVDLAAKTHSCGNFACDPIGKACFTDCQSSLDCRQGKSCTQGLCL